MQVLLNKSLQSLPDYTIGSSRENTAMHTGQSSLNNSACPCCSYILLRHVGLAGIYWRCSHYYQEMPVCQPYIAIATID
ncbi:hypothetical protein B7486_52390 [cyanobacterium TDX16]|nr:hypothetical protein B7486_52390 [cyanobacterium TDX16]